MTAINQRNYPVVQGGVLVVATMFILVTLLTDVVVGLVDPRDRGRTDGVSAIPATAPTRRPPQTGRSIPAGGRRASAW